MRLLLDTNILVWLLARQTVRFSDALRAVLADPASLQFASVASLWEMAIKVRLGKLDVEVELLRLPEVLEALGVQVLPIVDRHVLFEAQPVTRTRDPFDRLLLGQCQVESLQLVTVDKALRSHPLAWREA